METEDPDGDGAGNLEEYFAGTDPTNGASVLAMHDVAGSAAGSNVVVRWASVSNKLYSLWGTPDLMTGFSLLGSNIAATPLVNVYTDVFAASPTQKFYRVEVQHP